MYLVLLFSYEELKFPKIPTIYGFDKNEDPKLWDIIKRCWQQLSGKTTPNICDQN